MNKNSSNLLKFYSKFNVTLNLMNKVCVNFVKDNLYESFIVYSNDEDDDNYSNISEDFDRRVRDINLNLTRSLNGHGDDTISLYAYVDDECTVKKKISWEEWYLRKKIEGLKNEKQMKSKMQKVFV